MKAAETSVFEEAVTPTLGVHQRPRSTRTNTVAGPRDDCSSCRERAEPGIQTRPQSSADPNLRTSALLFTHSVLV